MQEDEPEEVGAIRTSFGPNPPRKGYNKTYRPYDQKYTPTDFQTKQRAETLWRQRMNVPRPQFGSIDPVNNTIPVQTVPVNDKGIMLSCDSLLTAAAEIDEWERSIDLAVGRTFSAWDDVRKLAYIEATMTGRAQLLWNNFKATEYYRSSFLKEFKDAQSKGTRMRQVLRLYLFGQTSPEDERRAQREKARLAMQKLVCCDMSQIDLYNETFLHFDLIMGEFNSLANRRAYFAKLPEPWNHEMTKKYKGS